MLELVELGTILNMIKGKKPATQLLEKKDGYLPYVDIEAFETRKVNYYADGNKCVPCEEGDILIVCDGSRSGLVGRAPKGYVGSTLAKISAKGVDDSYLFYFLQGKYMLLNTKKKGTGTPHLNPELLKAQKLVIPCKEEQLRIVNMIEKYLSQLEAGIEILRRIKQQLKVYRQAVLKDAFSKNNQYLELGTLIEKPRYGTSKKCTYEKMGKSLKVYRIPNIQAHTGTISHDDIKYAEFSDSELTDLNLKENDLLLIRSNGSVSLVGRTAIVRKCDEKGTFAGYLIRLRLKDANCIAAKYLQYYFESHEARVYIEKTAKSTSGVNNINSEEIKRMHIPWGDNELQKEVVAEIESKLSMCDSIDKMIANALMQAENMRQSILISAYEGRL